LGYTIVPDSKSVFHTFPNQFIIYGEVSHVTWENMNFFIRKRLRKRFQ
jgi:hypothetical protein